MKASGMSSQEILEGKVFCRLDGLPNQVNSTSTICPTLSNEVTAVRAFVGEGAPIISVGSEPSESSLGRTLRVCAGAKKYHASYRSTISGKMVFLQRSSDKEPPEHVQQSQCFIEALTMIPLLGPARIH